ncbi:MAG: ABC transporter permease [Salibacteraceae bacterium]
MNVSFSIAKRYLFSKKNRNVINIISGIAAAGVAVGSFAMIVVLSAFNGLESLVADLYTSVDPDIRIAPAMGKTFDLDSAQVDEIASWPEVKAMAPMLEETVFLQFRDQQTIVTLRGIEPAYLPNLGLEPFVIEGTHELTFQNSARALIGYGVADNLNLFVRDSYDGIKVFAANREATKSLNPQNKFVSERILPAGIVAMNPEFDYSYCYVPFEFASKLLKYNERASFVEITLNEGVKESQFKEKLSQLLGDKFVVKTRIELNDVIFKTNATEKWVTFFILSFILIVATFNLIGSLTMLIIDKKKDISLLRSIGQSVKDVQRVFLFEGLLITTVGALVGSGTGIIIVLIQQYIGFFPLQGGLVEYYPVAFHLSDLLAVLAVVGVIGFVASVIPVRILLNRQKLQKVVTN